MPSVFALFMLLGFFATLLIPETKGISLEDLSNEDQSTFVGNTNILAPVQDAEKRERDVPAGAV